MMEYISSKRARTKSPASERHTTTHTEDRPILNEEDEAFLHRIATEGPPPPLPARPQDLHEAGETLGNNAQIALMEGAQNIPLPEVPDTPDNVLTTAESDPFEKGKGPEKVKRSKWSFLRRDSRDAKRQATASGLMSAAEGLKSPNAHPNEDGQVSDPEAKAEEEEMTTVLEELNLAAVNNRVFSISKESQELLHKFTLVLKDLVNGVPTAYGDLESLLTNSEGQLQKSYQHLPLWLQKLVEQLPSKMTKSIGPEMLAAAATKHGFDSKYANTAAHAAETAGLKVRVPSLKDLVTKPGAVVGMLKAIMNFLKLRFPAFLGMNVLYSLALFILLFVLWYCHKRGREVRLEKERLLTEDEIARLDQDAAATSTTSSVPLTTTAPEGASPEEVVAGMRAAEVQKAALTAADESRAPKRTKYAEGGSLAQYEQEKARDNTAAVEVREVDDEAQVEACQQTTIREQQEKVTEKRAEKAARWRTQPSKASLDSQESCVVS